MILTILLLIPLLGLLVLLAIPSSRAPLIRLWTNAVMLAGFLATLPPLAQLDRTATGFQFVERHTWIPSIGASYFLGVDGYSLLLISLTNLLGFLAALCSWNYIQDRQKEYYGWFLFLQFGMIGVFAALDVLLFFLFWELTLVPMYFIIAIWGGARRQYAATKFLLYTLIGSVVMLLGLLALYHHHGQTAGAYTFDLTVLMNTAFPENLQVWVFWALFLGFAVKVPMWPFHTWLPDAHVEAPTAGSVILAGVLLKLGTYGFVRFALPLAPQGSSSSNVVAAMAFLSIVAILYGAIVCLMQKDWKRLVAYSSVSHMGFCTLGIFAWNSAGLVGSMLQQINHGLSTSLLFIIVGYVYERRHTRDIGEYSGLSKVMPVFTIVFLIAALSSMGLPPLNGFIGEITILKGVYAVSLTWAVCVALGVAFGAAYLLWLFQRTTLGELQERNRALADLSWREIVVAAPLVAGIFWIGLYPKPFLDLLETPAAQILSRIR